jgi:hypothetical protein
MEEESLLKVSLSQRDGIAFCDERLFEGTINPLGILWLGGTSLQFSTIWNGDNQTPEPETVEPSSISY